MFYKKEDLNDVITCEICSQTYVDPRILPCGESACNECILKSIHNNQSDLFQFECAFCSKTHVPLDGEEFPPSRGLSKLVKKKAEEVYRNQNFEKLKEELGDLKTKCDFFKVNMDNGVDQIKEHCGQVRKQIHSRTEILITQLTQINISLIAEVDEYEKECVNCYNQKIADYGKDCEKLLIEMNEFYNSTLKYMNEFKIDEKAVDKSLACVTEFTNKLKKQEDNLKKIKFNNRIIQFTRSTTELERKFIGNLCYKFEALKFDRKYINLNLFPHDDDGNKAAFYIDDDSNLHIELLDFEGKVLKEITDVLKTKCIFVTQSPNNYIFNAILVENSYSIFGNPITRNDSDLEILFMIDKEFNYLRHKIIDKNVWHMASNDSNIFCVDEENNFHYYNMDLELVGDKPFDKIREKVDLKTRIYVKMSANHLFILFNNELLGIFDLDKFDLVKEIEVEADRMKLVSTSHLILFDSNSKMLYLYNQSGGFEKLDQVDSARFFECGNDEVCCISENNTLTFSFYDN